MVSTEGYTKALELLTQAITPSGFVASPREKDNYKRVWTRDGVVIGIAALLSDDTRLISCFRDTLITLFNHQHPIGFMPSNVTAAGLSSYGGTVGRADNPSWAVIGLCLYSLHTGDTGPALSFLPRVEKCFHVMDVWEYNGKHLIYVPQSGDWADEYFYHGYLLTDQLLRIWALRLAARVYNNTEWKTKADRIAETVEINYWNGATEKPRYAKNLDHQLEAAPDQYWFMGFNPAGIYSQFDLLGNSLAILLNLGSKQQRDSTVSYIAKLRGEYDHIAPAFYPAVETDDREMDNLANNYAYTFRNFPHQFHNGGLWPVWNGFAVAALAKQDRQEDAIGLTTHLHAANAASDWNFNECLHGQTKEPIGVPFCSWSAAGAVIAEMGLTNLSSLKT